MKHLHLLALTLLTTPALCSLRGQGVTKPIISAPPPTTQALPPALSQAPTDPSLPPAVSASYQIGPQDGLSVVVWKAPEFTGPVSVRPDGMISLTLLGDVPAAGMTPTQLAQDLTVRLKKYVNDPLVTVTVLAVNSKHIFLLGNIGRVGEMAYTPDLTPMQAIVMAGGPTPFAKETHIYILRGENGKQTRIPFNYKKAVKSGDQQGVTLVPGDTIVVP